LKKKIPVNEPGFKCEPNSFFMDDCNSCSCDESGTLARCTAMACVPNERRKRETELKTQFTEAEARSKDFRCEANTNVKVDCNTCRCAADGQSLTYCTLIGCYYDDSIFANRTKRDDNAAYERLERKGSILNPYTEDELKQPGFKCEPDSSLKVGCRRCSCAKDGKSVDFCIETTCYKRGGNTGSTRSPEEYAKLSNKGGLLNPYTEDETKLPSFKCTPDASVKVDCKRCLCGDDGKTLTYCVDVSCYKVKNRSKRNRENRKNRKGCYRTNHTEEDTQIKDESRVTYPRDENDEYLEKYETSITSTNSTTKKNFGDRNNRTARTKQAIKIFVKSSTTTATEPSIVYENENCQIYSKRREPTCKKGSPANSYTESESRNIGCNEGESFWVECNTCWCTEDGTNKVGFCTRKSCKPKTYGTLPTTTKSTLRPALEISSTISNQQIVEDAQKKDESSSTTLGVYL
jgi:hypothetical protein